jgi:hypothetical protein
MQRLMQLGSIAVVCVLTVSPAQACRVPMQRDLRDIKFADVVVIGKNC